MTSSKYTRDSIDTVVQSALVLGNFDGVHIGHGLLINTAKKLYGKDNVLVCSFDPHPKTILSPQNTPLFLTLPKKKKHIIEDYYHVKNVFLPFTDDIAHMDGEQFIQWLYTDYNVGAIVVGRNYRFGHRASHSVDDLLQIGQRLGIEIQVMDELAIDGTIVSSSYIRQLLNTGNIEKANELLDREYSICGQCIQGRRIGNTIDFPTANIAIDTSRQYPAPGVYATRTCVDGVIYPSMTNIGYNPTVSTSQHLAIETHILGFDEELYGREIEVFFHSKIRNEMKFDSLDGLMAQLAADKEHIKKIFT